jgi:diacylglycerol kinase family enzyme
MESATKRSEITVKRQRMAAALALALVAATTVLAVVVVVQQFPRGLIVFGGLVLAMAAGWYGLLRRGAARIAGAAVAVAALAGLAILLIADFGHPVEACLLPSGVLAAAACAKAAFRVHVPLGPVSPPRHPFLFYNPKSGGGKAERLSLAEEARARGITPVELTRGSGLGELVRDAVANGADGLAMAGGDGSQAVVAAIASELDLPYACVPAGTRNHFALDLGVDRDDVVGSLDAFVDGGERRVDLAEVNGQVFVNNVSLGLYAAAVQRPGYREAKLRTLLDTVPDVIGPDGSGLDLAWVGPGGHEHRSGAAILVSNNRYRLGRAVGSGTRPRIDDGLLGVTVAASAAGGGGGRRPQRPWREWSAPEFEVAADHPVPAGIDGEAAMLEPPLRFRILPGALRVRIAPSHPGASPSAAVPERLLDGLRALVGIAAGRPQIDLTRRSLSKHERLAQRRHRDNEEEAAWTSWRSSRRRRSPARRRPPG